MDDNYENMIKDLLDNVVERIREKDDFTATKLLREIYENDIYNVAERLINTKVLDLSKETEISNKLKIIKEKVIKKEYKEYNEYKENINYNDYYDDEVLIRNKWIAILLCFTLGWFGMHKFYEDKNRIGKVYLFTSIFIGFTILMRLNESYDYGGLMHNLYILCSIVMIILLIIDFIKLLFKEEEYYVN